MALEFCAGCLIGRLSYAFSSNYNHLLLGTGFVLIFGAFYCYEQIDPTIAHAMGVHSIRILLFGIPSILIVYALVGLESNQTKLPGFMVKLGDASYSIYLSHEIVLITLEKIWGKLHKLPYDNLLFHIIVCILMLAAVICYGLFSYKYIEKPTISFFRNMIERREASSALKTPQ